MVKPQIPPSHGYPGGPQTPPQTDPAGAADPAGVIDYGEVPIRPLPSPTRRPRHLLFTAGTVAFVGLLLGGAGIATMHHNHRFPDHTLRGEPRPGATILDVFPDSAAIPVVDLEARTLGATANGTTIELRQRSRPDGLARAVIPAGLRWQVTENQFVVWAGNADNPAQAAATVTIEFAAATDRPDDTFAADRDALAQQHGDQYVRSVAAATVNGADTAYVIVGRDTRTGRSREHLYAYRAGSHSLRLVTETGDGPISASLRAVIASVELRP